MSSLTQVSPDSLMDALHVCAAAQVPAFIWGSPGIGKSAIVRQFCERLQAHLIDVRASQWDAVDTRGVPYVSNMLEAGKATTRWAIPSVFPSAEFAAQHQAIVIFLDELNAAPPSVQAALYQLILDRRLGDYVLPDNVTIVAAGNLETDRAVTHRMSTALAGRFGHLELMVDPLAWERWALENDLHVAAISFMRYRPKLLHSWDAKSSSKAQPTPRTWEFASRVVTEGEKRKVNVAVEAALVSGLVGEAAGAEFSGFLRIYRDLPDPQAIIMAPKSAPIMESAATNYALCGALAERTSVANVKNVFEYATRMRESSHAGPEFMTLLVRSAAIRHPEIQQTRPFVQWASDNSDVLL